MNFSSIVSFFCVSLGPWCFLLRLATLHSSQRARVKTFLHTQRWIQLRGPCLVDHGQLDAFTASFTVPRVSACWLYSWIRALRTSLPRAAVLLNTRFHVLRADCWCSSAAHTPSARCACRSLSSARLLWSLSCKTTS